MFATEREFQPLQFVQEVWGGLPELLVSEKYSMRYMEILSVLSQQLHSKPKLFYLALDYWSNQFSLTVEKLDFITHVWLLHDTIKGTEILTTQAPFSEHWSTRDPRGMDGLGSCLATKAQSAVAQLPVLNCTNPLLFAEAEKYIRSPSAESLFGKATIALLADAERREASAQKAATEAAQKAARLKAESERWSMMRATQDKEHEEGAALSRGLLDSAEGSANVCLSLKAFRIRTEVFTIHCTLDTTVGVLKALNPPLQFNRLICCGVPVDCSDQTKTVREILSAFSAFVSYNSFDASYSAETIQAI